MFMLTSLVYLINSIMLTFDSSPSDLWPNRILLELMSLFWYTGLLMLCFKYFETANEAQREVSSKSAKIYLICFWLTWIFCFGFQFNKWTATLAYPICTILLSISLWKIKKIADHENFGLEKSMMTVLLSGVVLIILGFIFGFTLNALNGNAQIIVLYYFYLLEF